MTPVPGRLILYSARIPEMVAFYCGYFGYTAHQHDGDRIVELRPAVPGFAILLHPAAKGQREGQAQVKLVFDVKDVAAFCEQAKSAGLEFGPIHHADGYAFANAKDPSKNSVSVSSRVFASSGQTT